MTLLCQEGTPRVQGRITLALASDLRMVRAAFHESLSGQRRLALVHSGGAEEEDRRAVARRMPQVTVLDLRDPRREGAGEVRLWQEQCPRTRLLLVRPQGRAESFGELFAAGAFGIVAREDPLHVLRMAIECLAQDRPFLARSLRGPGALVSSLDPSEQDVLRRMALGETFVELANGDRAAVPELRRRGQQLMGLVGCRTRDELLRLAIRQGLLPLRDENV